MKTKDLVLIGFYLALFYVLDVLSNSFALFKMPQGGTLSLSVIALILASYHLGFKKGCIVSFGSILVQFLSGPMYIANPLGFILDYLIAFGFYGLASLFKNPIVGSLTTNFVRFISHVLSGIWVWQTALWPSITYNGLYMLPTAIVSTILVYVLIPKLTHYWK